MPTQPDKPALKPSASRSAGLQAPLPPYSSPAWQRLRVCRPPRWPCAY